MNRKIVVRGALLALITLGLFKFLKGRRQSEPGEVWTTADIPDLDGKVIIVTGANSGIGFEAAREFARNGAQVVLACRNMEKAQAALGALLAEIPQAKVEVMQLDLASQASVHAFADAFRARHEQLHVLVNNAGIMMVPYGTTEDGFERQLGTNHLGHFALTGLLIDLLLSTPGSRVVNVSSNAHSRGSMDFADLNYADETGYTPYGAYGRSKLANLLFTYELQRRYEADRATGSDAIAVAAHPGISDTNLGTHLYDRAYLKSLVPLLGRLLQSAAMGALPTIRAAVDPDVQGGTYYGPNGFRQMRGYPIVVQSNAASHDVSDARRLWTVSEELTGVHYLD